MRQDFAGLGINHLDLDVGVHPADGRSGASGELCTRGYSVMLGYWNNEEATRQAIDVGRALEELLQVQAPVPG